MTDVSIIIVSYNSAQYLPALLDSIKRSRGVTKEIIIVDNASTDDSVQTALRHKAKPIVIKSKQNLGFARAVNLALKRSVGEFVFLLNPDTRLIGSGLSSLVAVAKKTKPLGALAPRLVDPSGKNQASAFRFPTIANAFLRYFLGLGDRYGKYLPVQKRTTVDVAVMAAFLIPRTAIEQVGLLDERFFLYYEDIEYCRRLRKAGLPVIYYPKVKVEHFHGASGSFRSHHQSPLLASAVTYHGSAYFKVLNSVLWLGQKFDKLLRRFRLR